MRHHLQHDPCCTELAALHILLGAVKRAQRKCSKVRGSQVSFKDLFTALLALQPTVGDHCPACDTPLKEAAENPYEVATKGLADLGELAALQTEHAQVKKELEDASQNLFSHLGILFKFVTAQNEDNSTVVGRYLSALAVPALELPALEDLMLIADRVAAQDAVTRFTLEAHQLNINERDRINQYRLLAQAQDTKRKQSVDAIQAARVRGAWQ